jgi:hypothetical protein
LSVGGWEPSGAANQARALGGAGDIALGRWRRSPSWAVVFGNPRSQQHGDGEILRSQYEATFVILGNLKNVVDLIEPFEIPGER